MAGISCAQPTTAAAAAVDRRRAGFFSVAVSLARWRRLRPVSPGISCALSCSTALALLKQRSRRGPWGAEKVYALLLLLWLCGMCGPCSVAVCKCSVGVVAPSAAAASCGVTRRYALAVGSPARWAAAPVCRMPPAPRCVGVNGGRDCPALCPCTDCMHTGRRCGVWFRLSRQAIWAQGPGCATAGHGACLLPGRGRRGRASSARARCVRGRGPCEFLFARRLWKYACTWQYLCSCRRQHGATMQGHSCAAPHAAGWGLTPPGGWMAAMDGWPRVNELTVPGVCFRG
jgi:hypothetical protein